MKELVMKTRQSWFGALAIVVSAGSLGCGAPAASSVVLDRARFGERVITRPSMYSSTSSSLRSDRHRINTEHSSADVFRRARR
jgi:hypothetical protein